MKWDFQGWLRKNNVEFPGVFVFCLGIPERSNSILWNIQGFSFVLSGISKGKVKKWEISGGGGGGQKGISSIIKAWIFSGKTQCYSSHLFIGC